MNVYIKYTQYRRGTIHAFNLGMYVLYKYLMHRKTVIQGAV